MQGAGFDTLTDSLEAIATGVATSAAGSISTTGIDNLVASQGDWTTASTTGVDYMVPLVTGIQGSGFNTFTDSLDAIRERGDAAWTGGSSQTGIDTAIGDLSEIQATLTGIEGAGFTTVTDSLESIRNAISGIDAQAGAGSTAAPVTVTDGSNPIEGVAVWVTRDEAGTDVIAGTLYTDTLGMVTFYLDVGSYYAWKQLAGYNFTNPEIFTVT
jgi:hypothetical protein